MWLWLACAPDLRPTVEAVTEDGVYTAAIASDTWPQGAAALRIDLDHVVDGTPAIAVGVRVVTFMPAMDHEDEAIVATEEEAGEYAADVFFSMPGLWLVVVEADGSPAELVVSVE